ncbi:hypothetical protein BC835DRAFT_227687 [Cytidiella melzeri]|nr:hypothetical protein BC835DRAFT_227687 [Cytidiella melzeri]
MGDGMLRNISVCALALFFFCSFYPGIQASPGTERENRPRLILDVPWILKSLFSPAVPLHPGHILGANIKFVHLVLRNQNSRYRCAMVHLHSSTKNHFCNCEKKTRLSLLSANHCPLRRCHKCRFFALTRPGGWALQQSRLHATTRGCSGYNCTRLVHCVCQGAREGEL